jgi:hypothetical protein
MYRSDAQGRLARSTLREYERLWIRRLEPRFGHLALEAIRTRMVSEWRAELLAAGVGAEAMRYAMVLLQAMFTLAIRMGRGAGEPGSRGPQAPPGAPARDRPPLDRPATCTETSPSDVRAPRRTLRGPHHYVAARGTIKLRQTPPARREHSSSRRNHA